MAARRSALLEDLKNYSLCTPELAQKVRKAVLEPFQVNLETLKTSPSPQEFKQMAVRLAPLALRIVNQNLETLTELKKMTPLKGIYRTTSECLIYSSLHSLAGLRHMNTLTTLKPLDIEKLTSNLIGKIVNLGEYEIALSQLAKFRVLLASVINVSLGTTESKRSNQGQLNILSKYNIPQDIINNEWEQRTISEYHDLFQFTLNPNINDHSTIMLVLAHQMNTIRCFCELKGGVLAKYLPYLYDRPGNFVDWCKTLLPIDSSTANKQINVLQKILLKAGKAYQTNDKYVFYTFQCLALNPCLVFKTKKPKSILDYFVKCSLDYEKSKVDTNYQYIQSCCEALLSNFTPDCHNLAELDSYFVFCDFYAYVSEKNKSYQGTFYAYKNMIRPIRDMVGKSQDNSYYYSIYAATAKLSLCTIQMDKMVLDNNYIDVSTTFKETVSCLELAISSAKDVQPKDDHSTEALINFTKSSDTFIQSAKRFYEAVLEKAKRNLLSSVRDPLKTPPRPGEIITPSNYGAWNNIIPLLNGVLQCTRECIDSGLGLISEKFEARKKEFQLDTMLATFVKIMLLLVRTHHKVEDEDSYFKVLEFLDKTDNFCFKNSFSQGYNWLSESYYSLGGAFIRLEIFPKATHCIRKAAILLEKHAKIYPSDEKMLRLSNLYEILGTCRYKGKEFEEACQCYRLALRHLPISKIERFVGKRNSKTVAALGEEEPFLPKLMDRFLRASIVDPNQQSMTYACEYLQLSAFDHDKQGIILECELRVWGTLSLKTNVSKFQMHIVEKLLEVYSQEQYPLRRTRVLLDRVRIEKSKSGDKDECTRKALKYALEAHELLKENKFKNDKDLWRYKTHYMALTASWIAICGYDLKEAVPCSFSTPFLYWNNLFKSLPTVYDTNNSISEEYIKQQLSSIDDTDKLYAHLRMLADLFGLIGQYLHQINAFRLLLVLNNDLRTVKTNRLSESVTITCEIAKLYCFLGYTGKASVEYEKAQKLISKSGCSNFTELTFLIGYSQYLITIGDLENSKKTFKKAKSVWSYNDTNELSSTQLSSKNFIERSIILSEAYITEAMFPSDTLDSGIDHTTTAIRILDKCIKTFQHDEDSKKELASDPFSSNKKNSNANFKESQWKLAQKMAKCMEFMVQLYLTKGSWNEAQYYVRQGISLAQKLQSKSMLYYAYICSSDFNLRFGELEQSENDLNEAFEHIPDENAPKQKFTYEGRSLVQYLVYWEMSKANLLTAQKLYDEALELYSKSNKSLDTLSSSEHINTLDRFEVATENPVNSMDVDTKIECLPLLRMLCSNIIQTAAIYGYKQDYTKGIGLLEQLKEYETHFDEFQFNTTMAHLKLELTLEEISKHDNLKQKIKCLPTMNYVSKEVRKKDDSSSDSLLSNLTDSLETMVSAFQSGVNRERLKAINSLCNDTGFGIFLKNQIEVKKKDNANSDAWSSAYYLEMAKGIHARRLTQTCLSEKLRKLNGYLPLSQNSWPTDNTGKSQSKPSYVSDWIKSYMTALSEHYSKDHLLNESQFQQEYVDIIPSNWTVCSLTMDVEHNNMYAVQLRSGEPPFVIKLSLDRHIGKSDTPHGFKEIDSELKNIIEESDDTIQYSAQCKSSEEVKQWWVKRASLDSRLGKLLSNVEGWFGGFKGTLSGRRNESLEDMKRFRDQLNETIHKIIIKASSKKAKVEFSFHFCSIVLQLGESPTYIELEDVARFIFSSYEEHSINVSFSQVGDEIAKVLSNLMSSYHKSSASKGIDTKAIRKNDHVILILDKHMQTLPMENVPILRKQAVSRLPCLSFLRDRIFYAKSKKASEEGNTNHDKVSGNSLRISKENAYYVLNPSGDLVHTQKEFEKLFQSFQDWNGIAGTAPMELQLKDALQSRDLYMYFGHSAGQSFLRGTTIRNLPKCAVSLLMGCSSGKMESNGEYDPHGYIINYLVAGSPAVVGTLWDVTDRSIDKLTKQMLKNWGVIDSSSTKESLVQAVQQSRDACNLKFLIGAAPVVYGVPVYL